MISPLFDLKTPSVPFLKHSRLLLLLILQHIEKLKIYTWLPKFARIAGWGGGGRRKYILSPLLLLMLEASFQSKLGIVSFTYLRDLKRAVCASAACRQETSLSLLCCREVLIFLELMPVAPLERFYSTKTLAHLPPAPSQPLREACGSLLCITCVQCDCCGSSLLFFLALSVSVLKTLH